MKIKTSRLTSEPVAELSALWRKTELGMNLNQLITLCASRLHQIFLPYIENTPSLDLKNAMAYTVFNGGKRIRPLLIYATGYIFNAPLENLDLPACAIELIHTYSLIHDDLPCMDNADMRRNKPSCHKEFGEGMAVLTGDALQTLAMQILSGHPAPLSANKRINMLQVLSNACGPFGMIAGQALDITTADNKNISADLITNLYQLKTGALFTACLELGRLSSNDEDEKNQQALKHFGDCIGLAFQIQDDILDVESSTIELGKPQGIDQSNNKQTYPKIYGMDHAKEKIRNLYDQALESINYLGNNAQLLRELTSHLLKRNY